MPPRRVDPNALASDTALARAFALRPGHGERITFEHDGHQVTGRDGEPVAIALLAAGVHTLARSVKFHRPRGPSCLRGACDGCLTRVDGVPNIMACRVPAREGTRVHSQNSFPSARLDVLRVTDWFFPKLFDHHRLMVDYGTAINRTMQVFARRMAGLGTLPDADGPTPEPERIACDVLVVGAGPAGLSLAAAVARSGARVLVVEEETTAGGTLIDEPGWLETSTPGARVTGAELADTLVSAARSAGAEIRCDASATATFDNHTVVISPARAQLVTPRVRVFANGCHELIGTFESNDLPGVYTARAAARALAHGVLVGERALVVGAAWPAAALVDAMRSAGARVEWLNEGKVEAASGSAAVSGARVRIAGAASESKKFKCDTLIIADEPTPAYELLGQAGVAIEPDLEHACFRPRETDGDTEREDVFAVGSVRGECGPLQSVDMAHPLNAGGAVADGRRVAARVIAALQGSAGPARPRVAGARV